MRSHTNSHSTGYQGGKEEATQAYSASKASVEGEAPSGSAGGGGDASPYDRRADDEANTGSRMKANWYHRGFALLEVVVAMAIVGLGVVTLLEIFSHGLRLEAKSSMRTEATVYGRKVIDELFVRHEIEDGKEEGIIEEKYRWRLRIDSFKDNPDDLALSGWELKEIILNIYYMDDGYEKQVEMKTLRLVRKNR